MPDLACKQIKDNHQATTSVKVWPHSNPQDWASARLASDVNIGTKPLDKLL